MVGIDGGEVYTMISSEVSFTSAICLAARFSHVGTWEAELPTMNMLILATQHKVYMRDSWRTINSRRPLQYTRVDWQRQDAPRMHSAQQAPRSPNRS